MKVINIILLTTLLTSLTSCMHPDYWIGGGGSLLGKNGFVRDCHGNFIHTDTTPSEADIFWQKNNLPKGTTNYVCKDYKAYQAKKVTDCQNKLIYKQKGGLKSFQKKYNLNKKTMRFTCQNGTVTPD